MSDAVNHPKHYNSHPSGVECIEVVRHMGFNIGNVIKYLWRSDHKHQTPIQDLEKAAWYLNDEINLQYKNQGIERKTKTDYDQSIIDGWQDWNHLRPEVRAFATRMEDILAKHDSSKGDSWLKMTPEGLLTRVHEELRELELCLRPPDDKFPETDPEIVLNEAVDVANMVMFLAFVYDRMKFVGGHDESRRDSGSQGISQSEETLIHHHQTMPEVPTTALGNVAVDQES